MCTAHIDIQYIVYIGYICVCYIKCGVCSLLHNVYLLPFKNTPLSRNAISAYDTKQKYLEIYSRFVPFLLYLDYLTASTSALVVVGGVVVADGLMVDWRWCLMVEGVKVPWFWLLIQWDPLLASYTLSTNIWHAIIIFIINY